MIRALLVVSITTKRKNSICWFITSVLEQNNLIVLLFWYYIEDEFLDFVHDDDGLASAALQ